MKTRIKLYYYWDMNSYQLPKLQKAIISTISYPKEYYPTHLLLQEIEIDVPLVERPSNEFLSGSMIESLKEQNKKIQAEAFVKVEANNDKIRQLQCLTFAAGETC